MLEKDGKRAEDFHRLQLEKLQQPIEAVQLDERSSFAGWLYACDVSGLAQSIWTVLKYVRYPVHISDLLRRHWAQQRKKALESPLDVYQRKKSLPIS